MTDAAYIAEEYLSRVYQAKKLIRRLESTKASLRSRLSRIQCGVNPNKVQSSPCNSSMQNTINKIVDIEKEIERQENDLLSLIEEVLVAISRVPELNHRNVLIARYVENKKWDDLVSEVWYSRSWLFEIREQALEAFAKINVGILSKFKRPD